MAREIETEVNNVTNTGESAGATVPLPEYDPAQQESVSAMNDGVERQRDAESIPGGM